MSNVHKLVQEKVNQKEIFNGNDLIEREITSRLRCSVCNEIIEDNIKHGTLSLNREYIRQLEIDHNLDYLYKEMDRIYRLTGFSVFMKK